MIVQWFRDGCRELWDSWVWLLSWRSYCGTRA